MTIKARVISFVLIVAFLATGFIAASEIGNVVEKRNADDTLTQYTLNYDANGGENAPSHEKVNSDGTFVISTTQPEKDGCTFLGWSAEKNATEPMYQAGSNAYLSGNTTIYAVWSK